jgi:hypothetical protein
VGEAFSFCIIAFVIIIRIVLFVASEGVRVFGKELLMLWLIGRVGR